LEIGTGHLFFSFGDPVLATCKYRWAALHDADIVMSPKGIFEFFFCQSRAELGGENRSRRAWSVVGHGLFDPFSMTYNLCAFAVLAQLITSSGFEAHESVHTRSPTFPGHSASELTMRTRLVSVPRRKSQAQTKEVQRAVIDIGSRNLSRTPRRIHLFIATVHADANAMREAHLLSIHTCISFFFFLSLGSRMA